MCLKHLKKPRGSPGSLSSAYRNKSGHLELILGSVKSSRTPFSGDQQTPERIPMTSTSCLVSHSHSYSQSSWSLRHKNSHSAGNTQAMSEPVFQLKFIYKRTQTATHCCLDLDHHCLTEIKTMRIIYIFSSNPTKRGKWESVKVL